MRKTFVVSISVFASLPALAECNLSRLVGYTLIAEKTIEAWIEDGEKKDGYEGCNQGRVLVFTDGTGVMCNDYEYEYAYRHDAFIFSNGSSLKACIEGDLLDVQLLR